MLRLNFLMTALLAVALTACPSRDEDPKPDGGDTCVGECPDGGDAGTDGGDESDGGDTNPDTCEESPWEYDAERTFTDDTCTPFESDYVKPDCRNFHWDGEVKLVEGVEQVRFGECRHQFLRLENVVVVGIDEAYFERTGGEADPTKPRRNFWVADAANPTMGIWVHYRHTDAWEDKTLTGEEREIMIGDVLNIEAKLDQQPGYNDRDGRRWMLTNLFQNGNVVRPVKVELVSRSGEAPAPVEVPACFGDSNDGYNRPGQGHVGARIHIPGPLEITNATPAAFLNVNEGSDTVFGFEVTGGILVNNYKTYDLEGEERCDWRKKAIEAAAEGKKVVFPNGISGIWENYTHAPCENADCSRNYWGGIPGTYDYCTEVPEDGNWYTNVLFPQSCEDVVAEIQ